MVLDANVRGKEVGLITTAKQESLKIAVATDNRRVEGMGDNKRKNLLSLSLQWRKGEGDDGIIIPLPFSVQEPSQPLDLRGEVHDDDLHLDVKVELKDVRTRFEGLCSRGYEHVSFEAELLKGVDHFAEFCTPSQYPKLSKLFVL